MSHLQKAIGVSFFLYAASTLTTMAGMEIFSWVTFALVMTQTWLERKTPGKGFFAIGPDWALLAFGVVAVLSMLINAAPGADWSMAVGGQRWIFLVYMTAYAARSTGVKEKFFLPLLVVASVVCFHGVIEYLTGWDYIRHQSAFLSDTHVPRAAGFFSLPTRFASSFGMVFCFIVAALLLGLRKDLKGKAIIWIAFVLVGAALVLSGTRGALLAILIAIGLITFLVNRKVVVAGFVALVVLFSGLYVASPAFHARTQTLFDMNYESNSDRLALWKLNWEIFKHYPVLGVGLDENERRKKEFCEMYNLPVPHQGQAHNTYLQFASGAGTLGLLFYMIFIGTFLIYAVRLWHATPVSETWTRVLILGALGAQVSMHLGGLVDCNFRASEVRHLFILIIGFVAWRFWLLKNADEKVPA